MPIKPFPVYNENTAPQRSQKELHKTLSDFGMIPNLEGVMSGAPALLKTYVDAWDGFRETSFTAVEQEVVYLAVNVENNCEYCVPWHTLLAKEAGMNAADIERLRQGSTLDNERLEALRQFTLTVVRTRGAIFPADLEQFFTAGFTQQQALEVVLGVSIKVMSNYTNAMAQTPLDDTVKHLQWNKPHLRGRRD